MANTITATASLRWTSTQDSLAMSVTQATTQIGTNAIGNVQRIGITAEQILLGDVTTIGFLGFKNKDTVNSVRIGNDPSVSVAVYTLAPGQGTIVPTRVTSWYAVADVAPVDLLIMAIEL